MPPDRRAARARQLRTAGHRRRTTLTHAGRSIGCRFLQDRGPGTAERRLLRRVSAQTRTRQIGAASSAKTSTRADHSQPKARSHAMHVTPSLRDWQQTYRSARCLRSRNVPRDPSKAAALTQRTAPTARQKPESRPATSTTPPRTSARHRTNRSLSGVMSDMISLRRTG